MPRRKERAPDVLSPVAQHMVKMLSLTNYTRIGEAVGVKRSAVQKWAAGQNVTPWNLSQVENVLRASLGSANDLAAGLGRVEEELGALRAILEARTSLDVPSPDDQEDGPLPPALERTHGR